MCDECGILQKRIEKFRRFLAEPFDDLTKERLATAVTEATAKMNSLHPNQEK